MQALKAYIHNAACTKAYENLQITLPRQAVFKPSQDMEVQPHKIMHGTDWVC